MDRIKIRSKFQKKINLLDLFIYSAFCNNLIRFSAETVDITVKPKPKPSTTTAKPKEDLPHHNFYNEACSGCFLSNGKKEPAKPKGSGETPKTGIRTLSKELPNASPDKASGTKTTAGGKPSVTGNIFC